MNLMLHVLLGTVLFSCNPQLKEQSYVVPESTEVAISTPISENEILLIQNDSSPSLDLDAKIEPARPKVVQPESSMPNHTLWGDLLKKYVDDAGNVNYLGFKDEISKLDSYLMEMAQNPPSESWTKNDKLAYYINLYNAATVKLIVDHYPLKSIKDIPNRWKKKWIKVGNDITSLNDIEHEVLRKMDEPRIHFAINCASYSCPKLLNVAFTSQSMERLLSKTAVDFVNDKTRNRFGNGVAQLSRIFKWYKGDFTEKTKLLGYINQYLDNPVGKDAKIEYLDYDWSLNETK